MEQQVNILGSAYSSSQVKKNLAIQQMNVNLLWQEGLTGKGMKIGIVDTGIEADHDMIKGKVICGRNFSTDGTPKDDINDYNYHGTAVASLVSGNYINHRAYGIAPESKLVIAKSLDVEGHGTLKSLAEGINYCIEQGVDIINCSIGCQDTCPDLENAVKKAVSLGISVVVASGNDGHNDTNGDIREISYPASYDESICVGAMDYNYSIAGFSNSNEYVDIVAPGVDVLCAYLGNRYALISGTSFACPMIAGVLALLKEKFIRDYKRIPSETELYGMLMKYTREIQGVNREMQGHGYFDASIKRIKKQ